jgi:probable HAF family extracellular repeat protein
MKTLSVALLLLASVAFVLMGCSDNSAMPMSPTDQSVVAAASGAITSTTGFSMIDLGSLVDPRPYCAYGVNSLGTVVGQGWPQSGPPHAFLWSRQYGVKDLGSLGEPQYAHAFDINDRGQVVGCSWESGTNAQRAFLWSDNGGMVNLGTSGVPSVTPEDAFSYAFGINNRGEIVGCVNGRAFHWTESHGMMLLVPLQYNSAAWDINNRGWIVGTSVMEPSSEQHHAVLWTDVGTMLDMGTLRPNSQALGINDRGEVVGGSSDISVCHERIGGGYYSVFDPSCLPFIWTEQNGMSPLPLLGGVAGCAEAINESGEAVGWSYTLAGKVHAFVWSSNKGIKDLGTLPGDAESVAYGINNLGQVVGYSLSANGNEGTQHAVVWNTR